MKITFKTVQNKLFTVDADEAETVGALKQKIQEAQTFPAELQKLIYSGKILKDESTVGELKIKEKDFLVVMVSKPKAPPAAPAASTSAATAAPAAEAATAPAAETAAPAAAADSTPAAPAATESTAAAAAAEPVGFGSSFLTGANLNSAIDNLCEMGFPRDQVVRAMRASFNNPDRAAEYLMSGNIPADPNPAPPAEAAAPAAAAPAAAAATAAAATATAPAAAPAPSAGAPADNLFAAAEAAMQRDRGTPAGAGAGAGAGGLNAIANSPQIARIRQAVQENPALIQPLLQQIAASNPQLAQLINQDPQALYELLGVSEDELGAEGEGEDYLPPNVMQVNLTQEEAAAVERLEQLGFDRQTVLQAFLLCDKNEELAANFLFESAEEDEQMMQ